MPLQAPSNHMDHMLRPHGHSMGVGYCSTGRGEYRPDAEDPTPFPIWIVMRWSFVSPGSSVPDDVDCPHRQIAMKKGSLTLPFVFKAAP